jgi:hypothetical protein
MKLKLIAALPLVAVLAAAPAFAGSLGTTTSEPEVDRPVVVVPPQVGGLGFGAVAGGLIVIALIGAMGSSSGTR